MTKKSWTILIILIFSIGLVSVSPVEAGIVPCGPGTDAPDCKLCHLWLLASNIINFVVFTLVIPIAILLFVGAGVLFLVSGGNENRIGLAKSVFTNTIIGTMIIFLAWLIVETLLKSIVGSQGTNEATQIIWAWNSFPACP